MIDTAMTARTARPLRFGLNMLFSKSVAQYVQSAPRAADIGFDVVLVGDHLGHQSPPSTLVAIADAVPSVRVGNLVLNAPLYAPALLARELATVDIASGGRLEIGLGSGYIERDFNGYGLPFPSAGQRVDMLGEHLRTIRSLLSSLDYGPLPFQSPPPILVAGIGDKMLSLAAQYADIVVVAAQGHKDQIGERIDCINAQAGSRFERIELAYSFFQVSLDLSMETTDFENRFYATKRNDRALGQNPISRASTTTSAIH
jgi:probable F420-dependent oxidoreductase